MHKARVSDTCFLSEKKSLTSRDLLKKNKLIQSGRSSPRKSGNGSPRKSGGSSPRKARKNGTKKKKASTEHEPTILETLANEYESSASEDETSAATNTESTTTPMTNTESDSKESKEAVIEETDHSTEAIDDNDNDRQSELLKLSVRALSKKCKNARVSAEGGKLDMIDRLLAKSKSKSAELENIEQKSAELPSSPIQIPQSLSEAALDVHNVENHQNDEENADESEHSELKCESESETETESARNESVKESLPLELDESSFFSILKTLDIDSLDKDGSGRVSCHYVRYFLKTKLSRHVADQHVLKVLQHINGGEARSVSTAQFKAWRAQMTSYSLEKILRSELVVPSNTKLRSQGSSSSHSVGGYLLDQTSLFLFLQSVRIKHVNDDSGYTKLFDFRVFVRRHFDGFAAIAEKDAANKIFADIDEAQQGRITNAQYNAWIEELSEAKLNEIIG